MIQETGKRKITPEIFFREVDNGSTGFRIPRSSRYDKPYEQKKYENVSKKHPTQDSKNLRYIELIKSFSPVAPYTSVHEEK